MYLIYLVIQGLFMENGYQYKILDIVKINNLTLQCG
jgi:hypothetical protein